MFRTRPARNRTTKIKTEFRERPETRIRFLSEAELLRLYRAARRDPMARAILLIGARHGPRACEIQYIRLQDVDFTERKLNMRRKKNSWTTRNEMQPDEIAAIKAYLRVRIKRESPALFITNRGTGIGPCSVGRIMKKYSRLASLPSDKSHFHVLKHTCAVHRYQASGDVLQVQKWLGHVELGNTMVYTRLNDAKTAEVNARIAKKLVRL